MAEEIAGSWFCYMVRSADRSLYIGITSDLAERVEKHNRGFGPRFTKARRPVQSIWSEGFADVFAARRREVELKGWNRTKKLQLVDEKRLAADWVNPSNPPLAGSQGKGE